MKQKTIMKKSFYILALVGTVLSGCNFLQSDNLSSVKADEQFSTSTGWNQLLNQAYYGLRNVYKTPQIFSAGTDMYAPGQGSSASVLQTYVIPADNAQVQDLYSDCYATINYANCVLKYSKDASLNDQAKFIRCYCYYILTQQFGRVPYITEYIESADSKYPRTELATIYEGLIAELTEIMGAGNLPPEPDQAQGRGRANAVAAKALLAKVYLAAGWDLDVTQTDAKAGTYTVNNNRYFTEAAKFATQVVDEVSWMPSFASKWGYAGDFADVQNTENLFAIQYDRATATNKETGGQSQQHNFGIYMGKAPTIDGTKGMKSDLCPTERSYYAFDRGDERYNVTFNSIIAAYDNSKDWGKTGYWSMYKLSATDFNKLPIGWAYLPWYTTDAEFNQFLVDNASRLVTTGYASTSKVIRIAEVCNLNKYKADGTLEEATTPTFSEILPMAGGYLAGCCKFDDKETSAAASQSNGSYRDLVVLDASDICLCAAEAYIAMDKLPDAAHMINKLRERSGASHLNSLSDYTRFDYINGVYASYGSTDGNGITINAIDVLLDERLRETFGQYLRWMDLRRTKQLVRYCECYNVTTADVVKTLRPIPANELQLNTGMKLENGSFDQNPGY